MILQINWCRFRKILQKCHSDIGVLHNVLDVTRTHRLCSYVNPGDRNWYDECIFTRRFHDQLYIGQYKYHTFMVSHASYLYLLGCHCTLNYILLGPVLEKYYDHTRIPSQHRLPGHNFSIITKHSNMSVWTRSF